MKVTHIDVKNRDDAWAIVNAIFPTDYQHDSERSANAGYDVYSTTREEGAFCWISDLGSTLEMNMPNGDTVNVCIVDDEKEYKNNAEKVLTNGADRDTLTVVNERKEEDVTMTEHIITVGLFDKDSKRQEISTLDAYKVITNLFCAAGLCATVLEAQGIYKHDDGTTVIEPSLRVECAGATREQIKPVIFQIKAALNQESIMYKMVESKIDFI